jgi:hypothetical protein
MVVAPKEHRKCSRHGRAMLIASAAEEMACDVAMWSGFEGFGMARRRAMSVRAGMVATRRRKPRRRVYIQTVNLAPGEREGGGGGAIWMLGRTEPPVMTDGTREPRGRPGSAIPSLSRGKTGNV